MDLREKPGKIQKFLELMLRFRLITLVVMVIAMVSFLATRWQEVVSLPLASSEAFGMWLAEIESVPAAWDSAQYLAVAGLACVVLFFVFGGIRSGVASILSSALLVAALYIMGGAESMPGPMFGIFAAVALVLLLFAKLSIACGLFPFALSWLFLSGLLAVLPENVGPKWLLWAVLSVFAFASSMAFSLTAGKHLGAGMPQAGALVKASKQMMVPVLVGALLLIAAVAFDMPQVVEGETAQAEPVSVWSHVPGALLLWGVFAAWFFVFLAPVSSFAPWERLRSGSRRVEMKDKKKTSAKSKKSK